MKGLRCRALVRAALFLPGLLCAGLLLGSPAGAAESAALEPVSIQAEHPQLRDMQQRSLLGARAVNRQVALSLAQPLRSLAARANAAVEKRARRERPAPQAPSWPVPSSAPCSYG
jgi:hypothetical protein